MCIRDRILIGCSEDGKNVVKAYFIMGRSVNSRNRIFAEEGEGIRTQAFDESKLSDPSLIIYAPVRVLGNTTIVTNGDQTDTVYDLMAEGKTFEEALRTREFEPDDPNYTPRISGIINVEDGRYDFAMSILKSDDGDPDYCIRNTFTYPGCPAGEARFIHTYMEDAVSYTHLSREDFPVETSRTDRLNSLQPYSETLGSKMPLQT